MDDASQAELLARVEAMERRLQACEDREAIREVLNRYNFGADTGDAQTYAETWAEDGVFNTGRNIVQGRDRFFEMIEDPAGFHKTDIESKGSLHTIGAVTIGLDGDQAWAEGPSIVWVREGKTFRAFVCAYNHWEFRKSDGRWTVTLRDARTVSPDRAKEVWKSYRTAV
jgi:uncharacterized protein (TIGR02246 family)